MTRIDQPADINLDAPVVTVDPAPIVMSLFPPRPSANSSLRAPRSAHDPITRRSARPSFVFFGTIMARLFATPQVFAFADLALIGSPDPATRAHRTAEPSAAQPPTQKAACTMTPGQPHIEPLGGHHYLVRVREGEDTVEIRMHASPAVVRRIAVDHTDETRIIDATVAYLIQRQRADDLPGSLDLDDVAAAYDGYIDDIHTQLSP